MMGPAVGLDGGASPVWGVFVLDLPHRRRLFVDQAGEGLSTASRPLPCSGDWHWKVGTGRRASEAPGRPGKGNDKGKVG